MVNKFSYTFSNNINQLETYKGAAAEDICKSIHSQLRDEIVASDRKNENSTLKFEQAQLHSPALEDSSPSPVCTFKKPIHSEPVSSTNTLTMAKTQPMEQPNVKVVRLL